MAIVEEVVNNVLRKEKNSLIWIEVTKGQQLFEGDFLKTEKSSSAKISFIDQETSINLDELTTTLIEKMNDLLKLNVLNGNMFIQSIEKNKNKFQILANNKTIDVSNADLKISVVDEKINLDVLRGDVKESGKNNVVYTENTSTEILANNEKIEKKIITIVKPRYGENIVIKDDGPFQIELSDTSNSRDYEFYSGKDENNLFPYKGRIEYKQNKFLIYNSKGEIFWKIAEKGTEQKESTVYRNRIFMLKPPTLVKISDTGKLYKKVDDILQFRWISSDQSIEDKLVIYDEDQKIVFSIITNKPEYDGLKDLNSGKYSWTVISLMANGENLQSAKSEFILKRMIIEPPPKLIFPKNNMAFTASNKNESIDLNFVWEKKTSEVMFNLVKSENNEPVLRKTTDKDQIKIANLKKGKYTLKLSSISNINGPPQDESIYHFEVNGLKAIQWISDKSIYNFSREISPISINWSLDDQVDMYNILIQDSLGNEVFQKRTSGDSVIFYPESESRFKATLTGLDSKGNIISRSDTYHFEIKKRPLLEAPIPLFAGKKIIGNGMGRVQFAFRDIPGMKRLLVEVKSLSGEIIRQQYFENSAGEVSGLLPGSYLLNANFIDADGISGRSSETYDLIIPMKSSISAPKVKGIKVQ